MEIEITKEQFDLIQDEIIRLEEELPSAIGGWDIVYIKDRILTLKEIIQTEKIIL